MEVHDLLNYTETEQRLREFLQRDAKSHKTAAIVIAVLGLPTFFIFPLMPLAFFFGAGYLMWSGSKNEAGMAVLQMGTVTNKKHLQHKSFYDGDSPDVPPTITNHYELIVDIDKQFSLTPDKATALDVSRHTKTYVVNQTIYQLFEQGAEIGMVLSPANDLVGFSKTNKLVLLLLTKELTDGSSKTISTSIPQTPLKKYFGWEVVED